MMISGETVVQRRKDLLATDLSDSESVVLDVSGGSYYGVRNVGRAIWDHLDAPLTVDALCEKLIAQFEVDVDTCRRETIAFLEALYSSGLILADGEPASSPE